MTKKEYDNLSLNLGDPLFLVDDNMSMEPIKVFFYSVDNFNILATDTPSGKCTRLYHFSCFFLNEKKAQLEMLKIQEERITAKIDSITEQTKTLVELEKQKITIQEQIEILKTGAMLLKKSSNHSRLFTSLYYCSKCNALSVPSWGNYCSLCGQKITWK